MTARFAVQLLLQRALPLHQYAEKVLGSAFLVQFGSGLYNIAAKPVRSESNFVEQEFRFVFGLLY